MPRFEGDLVATMLAVAEGRLGELPAARFADAAAMTVVLAAAGYPGTPKAGGAIRGLDAAEATDAIVFQAGTLLEGDTLVASGGRVLAVTAMGADIRAARDAAYRGVDAIDFSDGFCRRDIGWRELAR
jgi:phosphoribosylamine--glycine ligase